MPPFEENFLNLFILSFALAFSVGAAFFDCKERKIPNKYNLAFFIIAILLRIALFFIQPNYLYSGLIGGLIGFIIFFPLFVFRFGGAGDVKLLTVLGLLLGYKDFIWTFAFTTIFSGLYVLAKGAWIVILILKTPSNSIEEKFELSFNYLKSFGKTPYALWTAIGSLSNLLLYIFWSNFKILLENI